MPEIKSQYDQDLDALERTTFQHGYNTCAEDVHKILGVALEESRSVQEIKLIGQISIRLAAMAEVRFPQPDQQN